MSDLLPEISFREDDPLLIIEQLIKQADGNSMADILIGCYTETEIIHGQLNQDNLLCSNQMQVLDQVNAIFDALGNLHHSFAIFKTSMNTFIESAHKIKNVINNPVSYSFSRQMALYTLNMMNLNADRKDEHSVFHLYDTLKKLKPSDKSGVKSYELQSWDAEIGLSTFWEVHEKLLVQLDAFRNEIAWNIELPFSNQSMVMLQSYEKNVEHYLQLVTLFYDIQEEYGQLNSFHESLTGEGINPTQHIRAHFDEMATYLAERIFSVSLALTNNEFIRGKTFESQCRSLAPLLIGKDKPSQQLKDHIKKSVDDIVILDPISFKIIPLSKNSVGYVLSDFPNVAFVKSTCLRGHVISVSNHEIVHALSLGGFYFEHFLIEHYQHGFKNLSIKSSDYLEDVIEQMVVNFNAPLCCVKQQLKYQLSFEKLWHNKPERISFIGFALQNSVSHALVFQPGKPLNIDFIESSKLTAVINLLLQNKDAVAEQLLNARIKIRNKILANFMVLENIYNKDFDIYLSGVKRKKEGEKNVFLSREHPAIKAYSFDDYFQQLALCTIHDIKLLYEQNEEIFTNDLSKLNERLNDLLKPHQYHEIDFENALSSLTEAMTTFMEYWQDILLDRYSQATPYQEMAYKAHELIETIYTGGFCDVPSVDKRMIQQTRHCFAHVGPDIEFSSGYAKEFMRFQNALFGAEETTISLPYLMAAHFAPQVYLHMLRHHRDDYLNFLLAFEAQGQ